MKPIYHTQSDDPIMRSQSSQNDWSQWHGKRYYSLDSYLKNQFGEKVYRLSLDGGCTCPNRDGTLGDRGCIFCSAGGSGDFASDRSLSITEQIEAGKARIAAKTNCRKFIAYFQAFTNTYADIHYLRNIFSEALSVPEIVVLSIATRCDCLEDPVLSLLEELRDTYQKPIWIELGVQSVHDQTLSYIRSGFTYSQCTEAILRLHAHGFPVIAHLILGLPGETNEMITDSVMQLCELPISGCKLQLLHVLKNTDLATQYENDPFPVFQLEDYCQMIVDCIELIPDHIVLHRITGDGPKQFLLAPLWSGDKKRVLNRINQLLKERDTWQGRRYERKDFTCQNL